MSKLDDMYRNGFARCLTIVETLGLEQAKLEAKNRGARPHAIAGVSSYELRNAARKEAKVELEIVATALATSLIDELHLPNSVINKFLYEFNHRCDVYRYNPEEFEKAKYHLDAMPVVTEMANNFMNDKKEK